MLNAINREKIKREKSIGKSLILSRNVTNENIIKYFSDVSIIKEHNPNFEIDCFYPENRKFEKTSEFRNGVVYVDKKQEKNYMFYSTDLSENTQMKILMVGKFNGGNLYLLKEEFSNEFSTYITTIIISMRDLINKKKDAHVRIKYLHRFDIREENITEVDLACIEVANECIGAFNDLFRKLKVTD